MMKRKLLPLPVLLLLMLGLLGATFWLFTAGPVKAQSGSETPSTAAAGTEAAPNTSTETASAGRIQLWAPLRSDNYAWYERVLLVLNVVVALAGLGYAVMLVGQVKKADQGTPRMQEIARAVREGADAYLFRQFRVVIH